MNSDHQLLLWFYRAFKFWLRFLDNTNLTQNVTTQRETCKLEQVCCRLVALLSSSRCQANCQQAWCKLIDKTWCMLFQQLATNLQISSCIKSDFHSHWLDGTLWQTCTGSQGRSLVQIQSLIYCLCHGLNVIAFLPLCFGSQNCVYNINFTLEIPSICQRSLYL